MLGNNFLRKSHLAYDYSIYQIDPEILFKNKILNKYSYFRIGVKIFVYEKSV